MLLSFQDTILKSRRDLRMSRLSLMLDTLLSQIIISPWPHIGNRVAVYNPTTAIFLYKGEVRKSDDQPSDTLRVGVENSDDGATLSIKSIKIPTDTPRGRKFRRRRHSHTPYPPLKDIESDDGRPSVPLTPLCWE